MEETVNVNGAFLKSLSIYIKMCIDHSKLELLESASLIFFWAVLFIVSPLGIYEDED